MTTQRQHSSSEIKIKFTLDASSKRASEKLNTDNFKKTVEKGCSTFKKARTQESDR